MRPTAYQKFTEQLNDVITSDGKLALPNVEEITDPQEALNAIARSSSTAATPYHFRIRNYDPPLNGVVTHHTTWYPKIYLNHAGMGSRFDGSGVILSGNNGKAQAYRFHMCEHEWDESGANHNRGWHPKVCTKCGFDASIDSGD